MIYLIAFGIVTIVSVILRISSALGLSIPLAYGIIAPTLFYDWFHANQPLAEGIGYALLGLAVLDWVISLIRKISQFVQKHRDAEIEDMILLHRIKDGRPIDG